MFPTSGFFRSHNCPYYLSGLCERPYCHFRHVKQEERPPAVHPLHSSSKHVRRISESGESGPSSIVTAALSGPQPARQVSDGPRPARQVSDGPQPARQVSESSDAGSGDYTPTPLSVLRWTETRKRPVVAPVQPADQSYEPTPLAATSASQTPEQPITSASSPALQPVAPRRPLQLPPPKSDPPAAALEAPAAAASTASGFYDPLDGAGPSSKRGRYLSPEPAPAPREAAAAPHLADYEPTPIGGGRNGESDGDYDYGGGAGGDDEDDDEYCPTAVAAQPVPPPPPPPAAAAPPAVDAAAAAVGGEGSGIQQVFRDLFGEDPAGDREAESAATSPAKEQRTTSFAAASSAPTRAGAAPSSVRRILSPSEQLARRNQQAAANPSGLLSQGKVRVAVSAVAPAAASTTPLAGSVANKIPEVVRQRYLDRLAEECRLPGAAAGAPAPDKAARRAQQLELECYERSANRTVYLNAVILAIKRVRSAADQPQQPQRKQPVDNASQLSDKRLHKHLMQYALTEAQLTENKFPPHLPQLPYAPPSNPLERLCVRCGTAFLLQLPQMSVPPGQCCYHYGRAYSRRVPGAGVQQIYSCCGGDPQAKGCSLGARHVHEYNVYCDTGGYLPTTVPDKRTVHKKQRLAVYALDCEMVYTEAGKELARVTMIDRSLAVVFDRLVRPGAPIVDCNTRFSGLREEQLVAAEHRLADVQEELLQMVHSTCILVGHSLESDLQVLKLRHHTVVDTSIVFPHRQGLPKKRALRNLASEILNKIIQAGGDAGHDSSEDARACMELMLLKVTEDLKKGKGSG